MTEDRYGVLKRSVATVMGLGKVSSMPGTLSASVACFALLPVVSTATLVTAVLLVLPMGIWACDERSEEVVIDKLPGVWLAMIGHVTAGSLGFAVPALFLFRVFGLVRPLPVSMAERLPGGLGVMADDLVAGAMANLILWAIRWIFMGQPLPFMPVT